MKIKRIIPALLSTILIVGMVPAVAQAKTITKLSNGKYYYCDMCDYGSTKVKMKSGKLYLNGSYRKETKGTNAALKKAKLTLGVSKNVKLLAWREGSKKTIKKSQFATNVKNGCALNFTVKNKKVTRIEISAYTG